MQKPRPRRAASSNSGRVSGPGISRSKNASISAWSSIHHRGKNVVSASSGKTTRSQPRALAWCRCARRRFTTAPRESARAIGPSCAAPTVITLIGSYLDVPEQGGAELQDAPHVLPEGAGDDELPPGHVEHLVVGDLLHLVGERLPLGRVRLARELGAQLLDRLAGRPAEPRLVAGAAQDRGDGGRHRVERRRPRVEDVPAALGGRLLLGAA